MDDLNPQQAAFVEEYMLDRNATRAAARAGYSARTAHSQGPRLLTNVVVKSAIDQRLAEASDRADISTDWILDRLKHEALNADSDGARVRALELLGRYRSLFSDNDNEKAPRHEDLLRELDAIIDKGKGAILIEHDGAG